MSYNYQRISTRPDILVDFYADTGPTEAYIQLNYKDTGIFASKTVTYENGGLIQIQACVFSSQPEWAAFVVDPIVVTMIDARRAYETANGIFSERVEG